MTEKAKIQIKDGKLNDKDYEDTDYNHDNRLECSHRLNEPVSGCSARDTN
jgi:hypothetical protein